ncbi:MAG: zinc ribbon domain-containing protein [Planctomycetota bacterium]
MADLLEIGWLATTLLVGVSAVGALAVWKGLWWSRSRGRDRCPKCWHDMTGLAERGVLVCPECGKDARTAKRLRKTRRKRLIAAAGLLLVLLPWVWLKPAHERRGEGWWALMPTTGLIVLAKWHPDMSTDIGGVIVDRTPLMSAWQVRAVGAWAKPLSRDAAEELILYRKVWFRGEPVPVEVLAADHLNVAYYEVQARILYESGEELVGLTRDFFTSSGPTPSPAYDGRFPEFGWHFGLGQLPACPDVDCSYPVGVMLDAEWRRRSFSGKDLDDAESRHRRATHDITLEVRTVERGSLGALEQITKPVSGDAVDAQLLSSVRLSLDLAQAYTSSRRIRAAAGSGSQPTVVHEVKLPSWRSHGVQRRGPQPNYTIAFDLLVMDGDEVIYRETHAPAKALSFLPELGKPSVAAIEERLLRLDDWQVDPRGLRAVIRSRPDIAMYDLDHKQHWAGEIDVPLGEILTVNNPDFEVLR